MPPPSPANSALSILLLLAGWHTSSAGISQVPSPIPARLDTPLLRMLIHPTSSACAPSSGPPIKAVISHNIRSLAKEAPFWTAFDLWFSFQLVLARRRARLIESENAPSDDELEPWKQFGTDGDTDRTFVFVAHPWPESIAWRVPETDNKLSEGVGARDTPTKKGDDTFETILFMAMGVDSTSK